MGVRVAVVDLGTSSIRAVVLDETASIRGFSQINLNLFTPASGRAEQDAVIWRESMLEVLRQSIAESGSHIDAITITNQQISTVAVDAAGEPLAPAISWMDQRTAESAAEAATELAEAVLTVTGMPLTASWAPLRPIWWRENQPAVFDAAKAFLTPDAFLISVLTGRQVTDPSNACFTFLDIATDRYDTALADAFRVDIKAYPEVLSSGKHVGMLLPEIAAVIGVSHKTAVIISGSDQPCAALGIGAIGDRVAAVTGTGTFVLRHTKSLRRDPRLIINRAAVEGQWLHMGVHYVFGAAWSWFAQLVGSSTAQLLAEVEELPAFGDRDVPLVLPYFQGSRTPHMDDAACGAIHGLSLSNTRADVAKALIESNGFGIRDSLNVFAETGGDVREVVLAGAAASSDQWCQMQADAIGLTCVRSDTVEASARGAGLIALTALGVYADVETAVGAVCGDTGVFVPRQSVQDFEDRRYAAFQELYHQTKEIHV